MDDSDSARGERVVGSDSQRSTIYSNGSIGSGKRASLGSPDQSLRHSTSSSTRRKSAWKRVSQLYSPRQSNSAAAGDDLDEGGLWDNNDKDFQQQIALESQEDIPGQVHVFTSLSLNASVEEVCSPTEQRRSFLDHTTVSSAAGNGSTTSAAAASTRSLPVSSNSLPTLLAATGSAVPNPPSHDHAWQQRTTQPLALVDQQRPPSAGGASLFTSRSYSTVCSEASSALTYPSPGSSKVELHSRHRLSGPQQQKRLSSGKDSSPTGASFSTLARQQSAHDAPLPQHHSHQVPPAQHAIHLSGWTQEQIDSPTARDERRPGSFHSLAHASPVVVKSKSPTWTAEYATSASAQAPSAQEQRHLTAAESVRDQALLNLNNKRPNVQQLGEWQESTDTMVNSRSSDSANDALLIIAPSTKPLPGLEKSVSGDGGNVGRQDPSSDTTGLLSGLKKMLRTKRAANKAALPPPAPSSKLDARTLSSSVHDASAPAPYDGQRRPSLPHVGTAPAIPKARRLSMQVAQEKRAHHWSTTDVKAGSKALNKGSIPDSTLSTTDYALPAAAKRRRPSGDRFVQRMFSQTGNAVLLSRSPSRNSIIEHTSFDEAKRRSGVWSTMHDPVNKDSLYRSSSLIKAPVPISSVIPPVALEDAQEELQVDADVLQSDSDARSVSSIRSAPHAIPHRPPRYDEGETQSRPALDHGTSQHKRRPSIESLFNAAHDRRWSAAGATHVGSSSNDGTDAAQSAGSMASPSSSLLGLSEGHNAAGGFPAALTRMDSITNSIMSNDGASSVFSSGGNGKTSPEGSHNLQRRRSFVDPTTSSLAAFIKGSVTSTRKGSLSHAVISRPLEYSASGTEDVLLGDSILSGEAVKESSLANGNRSSSSSDEYATPGTEATTRRPSRSTNDLPSDGIAPAPMQRSASNSNLSSKSVGAVPKRPTFGLELQPDAAAAFDSIPLPVKLERRRSRSLSASNEHLAMHSTTTAPTSTSPMLEHIGSSSSLADTAKTPLLSSAADDFVNTNDPPSTVPTDLPADVEDVEDLLDVDGDQTLTDDLIHTPSQASDPTVFIARSADEMELLQEVDGPMLSSESANPIASDTISQNTDLGTEEEQSSKSIASGNEQYASLATYRFPAVAMTGIQDKSSLDTPLYLTPSETMARPIDVSRKTTAPSPAQLARRVSSSVYNAVALSPPPPPAKFIAAHLRRPSSSSSFV